MLLLLLGRLDPASFSPGNRSGNGEEGAKMGLSAAVVTANTVAAGAVLCSDVTRHEFALRHFRHRLPTSSVELRTGVLFPSSSLHQGSRPLAVASRIVPCVATKLDRIAAGLGLSGGGSGPAWFTANDGVRNCPKSLVASINSSRGLVGLSPQTVVPERGVYLSMSQRKRTSYESQR